MINKNSKAIGKILIGWRNHGHANLPGWPTKTKQQNCISAPARTYWFTFFFMTEFSANLRKLLQESFSGFIINCYTLICKRGSEIMTDRVECWQPWEPLLCISSQPPHILSLSLVQTLLPAARTHGSRHPGMSIPHLSCNGSCSFARHTSPRACSLDRQWMSDVATGRHCLQQECTDFPDSA